MLELKKLSEKISKNLILFLSILLIFLGGENLANPKNAAAETANSIFLKIEINLQNEISWPQQFAQFQKNENDFSKFSQIFWTKLADEYFSKSGKKNKKERIAIFSEMARKYIFDFSPENAEKILEKYPLFCRKESLCKIDKKNFTVYFFEKKLILKIWKNKIEYFFYDENGNFEKKIKYF